MSLKSRTFATVLPLLVFALLQVGCAARQIRAAQDAFSDGARIENNERTAVLTVTQPPPGIDTPHIGASATVNYRTALRLIDEELQNHKQDLNDEKLLGTALILKAMTLWRLADLEAGSPSAPSRSDLDAAINAATAKGVGEQLGSRDRIMADALDGLFDHDRGMWANNPKDAQRFFSSAYWDVDVAITKQRTPPVAKTHPVMTYLRLAQLTTLRSWQRAIISANPKGTQNKESQEYKINESIKDCSRLIAKDLDTEKNPALKDLINKFGKSLGVEDITASLNETVCKAPRYTS